MNLEIKNITKNRTPKGDFLSIKEVILGKKFEVSLVFCANALSRSLNRTYRMNDNPTNVLSFNVGSNSGEIFINLNKLDGFNPVYLFVHGCLHLKGMDHGDTMEKAEEKILKKFSLAKNVTPNRRRN